MWELFLLILDTKKELELIFDGVLKTFEQNKKTLRAFNHLFQGNIATFLNFIHFNFVLVLKRKSAFLIECFLLFPVEPCSGNIHSSPTGI